LDPVGADSRDDATTRARAAAIELKRRIEILDEHGLDRGPISGFDNDQLDQVFFGGTTLRSDFLCNLGYGESETRHLRAPRHDLDQACRIV